MLDRYIKFTKHARDRMNECQIEPVKCAWLIYGAEKYSLPRDLNLNKKKYSEKTLYYRNGTYVFTLLPKTDITTGDNIYLVISVYDQRMDL